MFTFCLFVRNYLTSLITLFDFKSFLSSSHSSLSWSLITSGVRSKFGYVRGVNTVSGTTRESRVCVCVCVCVCVWGGSKVSGAVTESKSRSC